ncbi:MAG: DUF3276 family protein [Saprospiraceae bacterium]|nr:DUF3276 family protein [Saprospiraceae bacterium]MCB9310889.1 DUF3276 family protein [Lewinellaceae bacterium]
MNDHQQKFIKPVYTSKIFAGPKRTYFIDIQKSRNGDHHLVISENLKKFNSDKYDRSRIHVYKEDIVKFTNELENALNRLKELIPEFDFDNYDRETDERYAREPRRHYNSDDERSSSEPGELSDLEF